MPHLIIGDTFTIIYQPNPDSKFTGKGYWYKTGLFLGDAISELEKAYPDIPNDPAEYIEYLESDIFGDKPKTIWGLTEGCSALCNFNKIVEKYGNADKNPYLDLSVEDVDDIRLYYRVNTYQYHDSFFDGFDGSDIINENAVVFLDLDNITKILIAALYYYTLHGYNIARCKHCGKWFATKTLKVEYCQRVSPCFGTIFQGKKEISCEQAVRNIRQNCRRLKNVIDIKAQAPISAQLGDKDFLWEFDGKCSSLNQAQKDNPTVENLTAYYTFLQKTNKERAWLK